MEIKQKIPFPLWIFRLSADFRKIGPKSTAPSNWNMYSGYDDSVESDSYPKRVYGTSIQSGISVLLKVLKQDNDPLCSGGINGFKVWPDERNFNFFYVHLTLNHCNYLLSINLILTVSQCRSHSIHHRKRHKFGKITFTFHQESQQCLQSIHMLY